MEGMAQALSAAYLFLGACNLNPHVSTFLYNFQAGEAV
jgi:hypothetical protein